MEDIENKIEIVLKMLQSEIAWDYQRYMSSEPKSIDAFVARNVAKAKAKDLIQSKIDLL